jgi:hypothetical protein
MIADFGLVPINVRQEEPSRFRIPMANLVSRGLKTSTRFTATERMAPWPSSFWNIDSVAHSCLVVLILSIKARVWKVGNEISSV